mmetsp:Transcript_88621/g.271286  ORF Transcript_88621/g.271286 Transcript_88621/m.271286 type:complete len:209 (-) Transcript_88621:750-1376(-)
MSLKGWYAAMSPSPHLAPVHRLSPRMLKSPTPRTPRWSRHFVKKKSSPQGFQGSDMHSFCLVMYVSKAPWDRTSRAPNIIGKFGSPGTLLQFLTYVGPHVTYGFRWLLRRSGSSTASGSTFMMKSMYCQTPCSFTAFHTFMNSCVLPAVPSLETPTGAAGNWWVTTGASGRFGCIPSVKDTSWLKIANSSHAKMPTPFFICSRMRGVS